MKPASFTYHRPRELDEALSLLDSHLEHAKIIAGGQSLVPMMNMRLARPAHLIDINDIGSLSYIRKTENRLHIGALARHTNLEHSVVLKEFCPIIANAAHHIGYPAIRERGTIGGSLANADPAGELPIMATLFNASITITSQAGTRIVPACEFFRTIYTTDLQPNELLTEVDVPLMNPADGWSYQEFSRRSRDFALAAVGTILSLDENNKVSNVQIALGGTKSIPVNVSPSLEKFLGATPDAAWMREITRSATAELELDSDVHATAEDRLEWQQVLIKKSLQESLQRANQGKREDGKVTSATTD
jgi:CO/xanthine dehydrogenase FAD-binding subunit